MDFGRLGVHQGCVSSGQEVGGHVDALFVLSDEVEFKSQQLEVV
jgi:hypothetical protein